MFLVNTLPSIIFDSGKYNELLMLILEVGLSIAWLLTAFFCSWKAAETKNPDTRFCCMAGLYGCYILFACAIFVFACPIGVENMVENGTIGIEDSALWTAGIISVTFAIWNIIALIGVVCWHFTKKRKEMSEMDRMKLEDL